MARVSRRTKVKVSTEEAWGAIKAFEHMIPQLRAYARAMTGNARLEIQVTAGQTRTDGNTIYISPPLALANKEQHNVRSLCGKRDDVGKLLCKACNIREVVNFYLYHEVSHILWGTLADYNEYSLALWHEVFNEFHHDGCEHYSGMLTAVDGCTGTIGLAGLLTPFTGMMQNALEDARVNERTFEQRPGLRKIFQLNMDRMLVDGSEQLLTGERLHWRDQPLDAQFMVGLYFQASGYDYASFLHEDAVKMLQHPEIVELTAATALAKDADAVFAIVVAIWKIAQANGFCVVDKCIKPEPIPEDKEPDNEATPEPAESPSGDPGDGLGADASDSGSDGGGAGDGHPAPGGDAGGGSSEAGDGTAGNPGGSAATERPGTVAGGGAGEGSGDSGGDVDVRLDDPATPRSDDAHRDDRPGTDSTDSGADPDESRLDGGGDSLPAEPQAKPDGTSQGDPVSDDAGLGEGGSAAEESPEVADLGPEDDSAAGPDDGHEGGPAADPSPGSELEESGRSLRPDELAADTSDEGDRVRGGWVDGGTLRDGVDDGASDTDADADGDPASPGPGDAGNPLGEADSPPEGNAANDGAMREAAPEEGVGSTPDGGSEPSLESGVSTDGSEERVADQPTHGAGLPADDAVDGPSAPVGASDGPALDHGTPDDAVAAVRRVLIHKLIEDMAGDDAPSIMGGGEDIGCDCDGQEHEFAELDDVMREALEIAIAQRKHFDTAAFGVKGLNVLSYPNRFVNWRREGAIAEYMPDAALLSRPTLLARRFFEANMRSKFDSGRKSGRVDTRVLGRRAPTGDPRLFGKKALPKRHSYAVTIVVDCSGSMGHHNMERIKRYSMAMGEILHRLGIKFSMFGHTADTRNLDDPADKGYGGYDNIWMYVMPVKEMHEPWNDKAREKLVGLSSCQANLDGHALEYARKQIMKADATDRIIFYFSDGGMPAENHDEEKEILEREIPFCRKQGITLLGGGIDSDATARVGMDTVMLRRPEDITKLIEFLQKNLTRSE